MSTETTTATATETRVNYEDVDDIIDVAARAMEESYDYLSVEELESVAADLDIPREYVEPAIAEVRRRRQEKLAAEAAIARRNRYIWIGVGAVVVLLLGWVFVSTQTLSSKHNDVIKRRSQVTNVIERQVATENRWRGKPEGPDKTAELAGAENRVRIERKRYDEVATTYNNAASGFPGGLASSLAGLPDAVPLSAEIAEW